MGLTVSTSPIIIFHLRYTYIYNIFFLFFFTTFITIISFGKVMSFTGRTSPISIFEIIFLSHNSGISFRSVTFETFFSFSKV
mmetsp:Transcript_452/g.53  ORF Transcript_452/g.53 Transcript_452/m.53 type:complete len:82 (-) Transcript_452:144-389(-)